MEICQGTYRGASQLCVGVIREGATKEGKFELC